MKAIDHIRELKAEVEETEEALRLSIEETKAAEAKLAAIAAWYERNRLRLFDVNDDELEALLKEQSTDKPITYYQQNPGEKL